MDTCVITQRQVHRYALCLVIVFCVGFSCGGMIFVFPVHHSRAFVPEKINPNTAIVGSLIRLPGIGPQRAQAIVSYRDQYHQKQATRPAFHCPADMANVRGLGLKTVAEFSQWLDFD